jgi:hypothetical protein
VEKKMMMETLRCFTCKLDKPLNKYKNNNRHYQIKAYKGKCVVCKLCSFQKALNDLSVVRYNFEEKGFNIIKFNDYAEVAEFFRLEGGEF